MTTSPQPESPEPLKVVAYLTTDEEGSPAMLFFDRQEAGNYCDVDEQPARLSLTDDAEAAIQAARNEAEAMRAFASFFRDRGEELFCHFGMEAIDLYNAAMKGDAHA